MAKSPPARLSALADYEVHHAGESGRLGGVAAGVTVQEVGALVLYQVAAWPESVATVGAQVAQHIGVAQAPGPRCVVEGNVAGERVALLRVEPLKWWVIGGDGSARLPTLSPAQGTTLDLSHARTHIRIAGPNARDLLNRLIPLDLRPPSFPTDRVATTMLHDLGITLWHSAPGFELFIPRGFARSIWENCIECGQQFGLEIG